MSQERLPEDLSAWPKNIFQLLGVPHDVERRALRQAYTALIRRFKPEHYPDHFRRIRDAYEAVLKQVEWREARQTPTDNLAEFQDPIELIEPLAAATADVSHEPTEPPKEPADIGKATPDPIDRPKPIAWYDELDTLWQRAIARDTSVYQHFVELESQHIGHRKLCLRLYWLLVAWPELDSQREPCDWLVRGMRVGRLAGPLAELYRREVEARPEEALTPRCAELLDCAAQPGALADLVTWRWQAAGKLDQLDLIAEDLEHLRERLFPAAEEIWSRLLLAALDQIYWGTSPDLQELADAFWKELDELQHLHIALRQPLDRVDLLRMVADGWRKLGRVRLDLQQLVRWYWTRPFVEFEEQSVQALHGLLETPHRMLMLFDRIHQASPAVLAQIGELIAMCGGRGGLQDRRPDPEHIRALARVWIESHFGGSYRSLRPHLLDFCIREQVAPDWLVSLPGDPLVQPPSENARFVQQLSVDGPLKFAYLAHRAMGA